MCVTVWVLRYKNKKNGDRGTIVFTATLKSAYRVIKDNTVVTAVQGYTLKLAYHTVVSEEGWAGRVDGVQETGILREVPPSSCSLPNAPRQPIAPNFQ